jgi:hypothetical protein
MDRSRPEYELFLVLTFFSGHHDFRRKPTFFPWLRRNPFRKKLYFSEIFINFLTTFLGPWLLGVPPQHHIFPNATTVVKKIFQKAARKLFKNLPFHQRLSKTFLWLRIRFPKYDYPRRKILQNRFLLFIYF